MAVLRLAYDAAGLGWVLRPTGVRPAAAGVRRRLPRLRPPSQVDLARASAPAIAALARPARQGGRRHERSGLRCHRLRRPRGRPCAALARPSRRRRRTQRASTAARRWRSTSCASARPADWAAELRARRIDAVVNCVGILMPRPRRASSGCTPKGRSSCSAAPRSPASAASSRSRRSASATRAEAGEAATCTASGSPTRPARRSPSTRRSCARRWSTARAAQSAALFATLASLPVIALPGHGGQRVQPIHVFELAEIVAGLVERSGSARGVYELGGKEPIDYRQMLAAYRAAQGLGEAIWLPVPMPLMALGAWLAELRAAARVQPRHHAPARARQRAGAQRRAGAARPRPERPRRRPGGDAAAAARSAPGSSSPLPVELGLRAGARLPLALHRGDQRLAAGALGRAGPARPLRLRRRGGAGGAGRVVRAQPDARRR